MSIETIATLDPRISTPPEFFRGVAALETVEEVTAAYEGWVEINKSLGWNSDDNDFPGMFCTAIVAHGADLEEPKYADVVKALNDHAVKKGMLDKAETPKQAQKSVVEGLLKRNLVPGLGDPHIDVNPDATFGPHPFGSDDVFPDVALARKERLRAQAAKRKTTQAVNAARESERQRQAESSEVDESPSVYNDYYSCDDDDY